jgi:hypothetical protein
MKDTLREIRERLDELELELRAELAAKQERFRYTVEKKRVRFSQEVQDAHRLLAIRWTAYAYESGLLKILTIPIIWFALIPALVLDFFVLFYQLICFPIYGIPRVRRSDHIVFDRHKLKYLNWMEKFNCMYCSYFNGLMAYLREIAGRTEQYWCPIRHARLPKNTHSRYDRFVDYGDAEGYRRNLDKIRKDFQDCGKRDE